MHSVIAFADGSHVSFDLSVGQGTLHRLKDNCMWLKKETEGGKKESIVLNLQAGEAFQKELLIFNVFDMWD